MKVKPQRVEINFTFRCPYCDCLNFSTLEGLKFTKFKVICQYNCQKTYEIDVPEHLLGRWAPIAKGKRKKEKVNNNLELDFARKSLIEQGYSSKEADNMLAKATEGKTYKDGKSLIMAALASYE